MFGRIMRRNWWMVSAKDTLDHATASLLRLLYERLPETGVDFAVLYPTLALAFPNIPNEELSRLHSSRAKFASRRTE